MSYLRFLFDVFVKNFMKVGFLRFNSLLKMTLILIKTFGCSHTSLLLRKPNLIRVIDGCLSYGDIPHWRENFIVIKIPMTLSSLLDRILLLQNLGINSEISCSN